MENKPLYTDEQIAERLLFPLWQCLSSDYKKRRAKDIWDDFEKGIWAAASKTSLPQFVEEFKMLLPTDWEQKHSSDMLAFIQSGQDEHVLSRISADTFLFMLLTRKLNETKKSDYKERQAAKMVDADEDVDPDAPLFPEEVPNSEIPKDLFS